MSYQKLLQILLISTVISMSNISFATSVVDDPEDEEELASSGEGSAQSSEQREVSGASDSIFNAFKPPKDYAKPGKKGIGSLKQQEEGQQKVNSGARNIAPQIKEKNTKEKALVPDNPAEAAKSIKEQKDKSTLLEQERVAKANREAEKGTSKDPEFVKEQMRLQSIENQRQQELAREERRAARKAEKLLEQERVAKANREAEKGTSKDPEFVKEQMRLQSIENQRQQELAREERRAARKAEKLLEQERVAKANREAEKGTSKDPEFVKEQMRLQSIENQRQQELAREERRAARKAEKLLEQERVAKANREAEKGTSKDPEFVKEQMRLQSIENQRQQELAREERRAARKAEKLLEQERVAKANREAEKGTSKDPEFVKEQMRLQSIENQRQQELAREERKAARKAIKLKEYREAIKKIAKDKKATEQARNKAISNKHHNKNTFDKRVSKEEMKKDRLKDENISQSMDVIEQQGNTITFPAYEKDINNNAF